MTRVYTEQVQMVLEMCYKCGMPFGLESDYQDRMRKTGDTFYCPRGHAQVYTEAEVTVLKRKLASAESDKQWWRNEAEAKGRRLIAMRGVVTKLKNRAAEGQCPCCKKHFKVLAKHMTKMHPDFAKVEEVSDKDE